MRVEGRDLKTGESVVAAQERGDTVEFLATSGAWVTEMHAFPIAVYDRHIKSGVQYRARLTAAGEVDHG